MNFKAPLLFLLLVASAAVGRGVDNVRKPIFTADSTAIYDYKIDPIIATYIADDSTQAQRDKAAQLDQKVREENLTIMSLNQLTYVTLPVGIQKQIGPLEYTIIISSIESTPAGSFLEAYFMFEIPSTGDKIAFRGSKIPYSDNSGFSGRGRLELIGDYHIVINSSTLLTLVGKGNSFVEFDCDGFAGMGLEANIEFSRDLIVPEDARGEVIPAPARVTTNFVTQIQNWNDILIQINLPTFQVNGLKDVSFTVQNAALDWSDLMNPAGMVFPDGYVSPFLAAGQPSLWQGIYIQHLDVKLPKAFSKSDTMRVAIGVQNMLLDEQGFTGKVFAQDVLSRGNMSGWAFTIGTVSLDVVVNQVRSFEIGGKLTVPQLKTADKTKPASFDYLAHVGADGNFLFAISVPKEGLAMEAFAADVKLFEGSAFTVVERNDKFYPTALLNGELTIKGPKANFNNISFQGLRISTEEPKFDIQYVGFGNSGNQKVSKFPVVIKGISVRKNNDKFGLAVDLVVNIGGSPEEGGFGGGGEVIVWAKQESVEVKDAEGVVMGTDKEWKLDRVEIGGITVSVSKPNAFELSGSIQFFDGDQVYGDGFKGAISGSIGKVGGLSVKALFGTTGEFRYWYADAMVKLPTRVPIIPPVVFANSFGGGFYYKMKQTDQRPASTVALAGENPSVYYIPDKNSMGIKAVMQIEAANKAAMNGMVALELMMNRHGGINSITLSGNANFMSFAELLESELKDVAGGMAGGRLSEKLAKFAGGQVRGAMLLKFDNVNDVFHGNIEVFIHVAGGIVKGVGANSRAGWAVIHFEKNDWYIHIGTPTDPIGLEVAKVFQAKSYFMLGKNLPGSPPPPPQVTEILGPVDLDYMRDMNALQSGAGFAFGLHFLMDTGDLTFLMFYGRFAAGTGVDFMLKNYGTDYHCQGSSEPFGINGWYANGQAYAFVMGKIGIKVKLKFYKGNFDIISIGAAAVLQAKGPNPFWMKGIVGGNYSILGGMIKGKCRFEMEIGKKCIPVGEQNVLADQQMIAEISPAEGTQKVDVFTNPQVAFNIPVGQEFHITDADNRNHVYRARLDKFELFESGKKLDGSVQWNEDKTVAVFDGLEILPGESNIQVKVKLLFEERKNGSWTAVFFQGVPVDEVRAITFQTDKAPDYIPKHNVLASYPVEGQLNFLPREYSRGVIQLRDGQSYLFADNLLWTQKIRMTNVSNGAYVESALQYQPSEKKVVFDLPLGFVNSVIYDFEVLNVPKHIQALDANVKNIESQIDAQNEDVAILTTKDIAEDISRLEAKTLYKLRFRTSRYNTFSEKVSSITFGQTLREQVGMNVFRLLADMSGGEKFDDFEAGYDPHVSLVKTVANLIGNNWYDNIAYPMVYDGYPLRGNLYFTQRVPEELGVPPVKAIEIQVGLFASTRLAQDQISVSVSSMSNYRMRYEVGVVACQDFRNLQSRVANLLSTNPSLANERFSRLFASRSPWIRYGAYNVSLNYTVPGFNTTSSTVNVQLFNRMPDND